jgi:hypothetical protein
MARMPTVQRMLSPIVEGVSFSFELAGRHVRALITSDELEAAFGTAHGPSAWLQCFDDHEALIVEAACDKVRRDPQAEPVVVHAREIAPVLRG